MDRAAAFEAEGRGFESLQARHPCAADQEQLHLAARRCAVAREGKLFDRSFAPLFRSRFKRPELGLTVFSSLNAKVKIEPWRAC